MRKENRGDFEIKWFVSRVCTNAADMYNRIHAYIHTHAVAYAHTHIYIHIHTHAHAHAHIHTHAAQRNHRTQTKLTQKFGNALQTDN